MCCGWSTSETLVWATISLDTSDQRQVVLLIALAEYRADLVEEAAIRNVHVTEQEHRQAVDPNLVQLAAAYREANVQLGDGALPTTDYESADEADAAADADDVGQGGAEDAHEGMGGVRAKLPASTSLAPPLSTVRPAFAQASTEPVSTNPLPMNGHSGGTDAQSRPSAAASADAELGFIAADCFTGAWPGYVFRVGSEGTGYYRNVKNAPAWRQRRQAGRGSAAGELIGNLRQGISMIPIGGIPIGGTAAAAGTGRGKRRAEGHDVAAQQSGGAHQQGDDTDSDPDQKKHGNKGGAPKRREKQKALPGRLRKKLARERGRRKSG